LDALIERLENPEKALDPELRKEMEREMREEMQQMHRIQEESLRLERGRPRFNR